MTDEAQPQDSQAANPTRLQPTDEAGAQPPATAGDGGAAASGTETPAESAGASTDAAGSGSVHETPAAGPTAHESAAKLQGEIPAAAKDEAADTAPPTTVSTAEVAAQETTEKTETAASLAPVVAEPAPAAVGANPAGGSAAPSAHLPDTALPAPGPDATEAATADGAGTSDEAPAGEQPAGEQPGRASDRLRDRMSGQGSQRAVGSEDIKSQRPEVPTDIQPVEIPDMDEELDASLEAEISSALGSEVSSAPSKAAPAGEADATATGETSTPASSEDVGPGSQVSGTVQHIHGDDVFLNAGLRSDIVVSLKQFPEGKPPAVGDSLSVVIESGDDEGLFRARLPQAKSKSGGDWDALAVGQVVDCVVSATNKGGLQVTVSNLKGFLPASQVDLGYVADLEQYVGQKLTVQITEVKPKKRNLVVSRKVLLQAEREAQQAGFWESLEVGQDLTGTVKTIKNYGAFVNLGPIDGFLHIGEISWSRINHPNEVLNEGQEIQVRVLKIDKEKNRISLGMKQLIQNPWMGLSERYPTERVVSGKVTRVADFGAFVELEPGVEGLVHISQLAWRRVGSVNEVLSVGDEKDFQVLEVDQKRKRVSLSLKALEKRPESAQRSEADHEPRPPRKENPDLRGGMGSSGGGGLFGNPSDFS